MDEEVKEALSQVPTCEPIPFVDQGEDYCQGLHFEVKLW
jgi:hypothetical protein